MAMKKKAVRKSKPKKPKKWIKGAIKHPGRETARAKRNGISVHEQEVRDAHSKNPSLAAAGRLGLRLSGFHKKRKAKAMRTVKKHSR